ncbi:UDP-N-acetylmuramoyl-L-alanine--D-glutamate ligase [Candidatus Saccharibacteria bacterium]|nr:UDP-N-acetylmuramoyl-L-alanine--D-glutamate ligase [Candidatus Saccharibacteria bacterium]
MNIAIAGYGKEGRASLEYFRGKFPDAKFTIFDENPAIVIPSEFEKSGEVKSVLGEGVFDQIEGFDLVVRTAGLAPRKIAQIDKHWSSTREFFAECPAQIIGVTGTKGKGTTASFITEILRAAGKKVHLLGNIGVPALEILPRIMADDVVVYELSSFQLWDMEQSPHVAVMTLIEPDHLDVHEDFAEYIKAKSRIFTFQKPGDIAIYNEQDALVKEMIENPNKQNEVVKIPFLNKKFVHIDQGKFYYNEIEICPTSVVKLPGEHNLRNAAAAISAVWEMIDANADAIARGLSAFDGLPHRLKFVREVGRVKFYDDSIATTPGSAIAAARSFHEPKILIVGGHDKGADYHQLGEVIDQTNVRQIFAIGANRQKVAEQIGAATNTSIVQLDSQNLAEIVQMANRAAEPGDVVILSPAAASFDMFRNYEDRGEQFIAAVKDLLE